MHHNKNVQMTKWDVFLFEKKNQPFSLKTKEVVPFSTFNDRFLHFGIFGFFFPFAVYGNLNICGSKSYFFILKVDFAAIVCELSA
jgi:hypothetical protein